MIEPFGYDSINRRTRVTDPESFSVKEIVIRIETKLDALVDKVSGKVGRKELYGVVVMVAAVVALFNV